MFYHLHAVLPSSKGNANKWSSTTIDCLRPWSSMKSNNLCSAVSSSMWASSKPNIFLRLQIKSQLHISGTNENCLHLRILSTPSLHQSLAIGFPLMLELVGWKWNEHAPNKYGTGSYFIYLIYLMLTAHGSDSNHNFNNRAHHFRSERLEAFSSTELFMRARAQ